MASGAELALQMVMTLKDEATKKLGDISKAAKEADKKADGLSATFNKLAGVGKTALGGLGKVALVGVGAATAALGGMAAALATTIGPASDLSETMSKVGVVFGEEADAVLQFGETAATALGMTKNEALAAAGTYGNLFRAMGMTEKVSADMSTGLITLASDLASFNNMNPNEVLDKLRAGLSGETEPLKSLGVNLNAAAVEAKAMEMGLMGLDGELSASAKAQATYALVMEQTTLAQGDFARTSGGLANQQRILAATFGNLKTTIGTALLPVVNSLVGAFTGLVTNIMPKVEAVIARLTPFFSAIATAVGYFVGELGKGYGPIESLGNALETVYGESPLLDAFIDLWFDKLLPAIKTVAGYIQSDLIPAFNTVFAFIQANAQPILIGLGAVLAAVVVPAFISWAIAAGTAAIATLAAIAPFVALGAAVALIAKAWISDWGGIRTFLTAFYNDTLKPIIDAIIVWFQENIPKAIEAVSGFWTNTLLPAMRAVGDWITGTLVPILQQIWDWLSTNIPAAIETVSGFWNDTLLPAIKAVWAFINDNLIPLFNSVADVMNAALSLAITALAGLWENVLLPAIETVANWIRDNVIPVLEDIAKWVNDNVVPALQKFADILDGALKTALDWLANTLLPPLKTALEAIPGIIEKITGWFGTFADKLDALKGKLPAWLTPGSPTPLEEGLVGIGEAMLGVVQQFVNFGASLKGVNLDNLNRFGLAVRDIAKDLKDLASAFHQMNKVEKTEGGIPSLEMWANALKESIIRFSRAITEAAKEVKTSTINNAKELAGKIEQIFELLRTLGSVLSDLNAIETIPDMGPFGAALKQGIIVTASAILEASQQLGDKALKAAAKLSDDCQEIIGLIGPAVQAIGAMAEMKEVTDLREKGERLEEAINIFVYYINNAAQFWAGVALDAAVAFSESAQQIVGLVGPAAQAVGAIADMPGVADLRERGVALEAAINIFIYYIQRAAEFWANVALDAAVSFSENAGKIIALIQPAAQAVGAMLELPDVAGLREKGAAFEAAINILVYHIRNAAMFWDGVALDSAAQFSEAVTKIVGMVKPGLEAIVALLNYTSSGEIAVGKAVYSFKNDVRILIGALVNLATVWEGEAVSAAAAFGDNVSRVVGMVKPGIDAIIALMNYTSEGEIAVGKAVYSFKNDMRILIGALVNLASVWETEAVTAAAAFATSVGTIVGMIKPAIDAIAEVAKYTAQKGLETAIAAFEADLVMVVEKLGGIAERLSGEDGIGKAQAFATAAEAIKTAIETGLGTLASLSGGGASSAAEALGSFAMAAKQGLADAAQYAKDGATAMVAALEGVPGAIWDIFASFNWGAIGKGIADGIAAGITAGSSAIKTAAKQAAAAALTSAKTELGIASPSEVMREQVGQMMAKGWALGIRDMMGDLRAAMADMAGATLPPQMQPDYARAGQRAEAAMDRAGQATYNLTYVDQRPGGGPADLMGTAERLEWRARMRR